jgi:hypothetical protein
MFSHPYDIRQGLIWLLVVGPRVVLVRRTGGRLLDSDGRSVDATIQV